MQIFCRFCGEFAHARASIAENTVGMEPKRKEGIPKTMKGRKGPLVFEIKALKIRILQRLSLQNRETDLLAR